MQVKMSHGHVQLPARHAAAVHPALSGWGPSKSQQLWRAERRCTVQADRSAHGAHQGFCNASEDVHASRVTDMFIEVSLCLQQQHTHCADLGFDRGRTSSSAYAAKDLVQVSCV